MHNQYFINIIQINNCSNNLVFVHSWPVEKFVTVVWFLVAKKDCSAPSSKLLDLAFVVINDIKSFPEHIRKNANYTV